MIILCRVVMPASAEEPVTPTDAAPPPWSDAPRARPFDTPALDALSGRLDIDELRLLHRVGERLFRHRFTASEGGVRPLATQAILPTKRRRPPRSEYARTAGLDANACASCHHAPAIGGAGDFAANVFVSEGFQQSDFDTTDPQFSNERNTNHLFGAGLIELLAREMTRDLQTIRRTALSVARTTSTEHRMPLLAKGVDFGHLVAYPDGRLDTREVDGVDADLVVRPFSQKGVMTSLRQFTVNALNHHHGIQAEERFAARWTDEADFDGDGLIEEIGPRGVSALVAWQAMLPLPDERVPTSGADDSPLGETQQLAWQAASARGRERFTSLGCAECHRTSLPLESLVFDDPGPLDAAGTARSGEIEGLAYDLALLDWTRRLERDADGRVLVPLFGDLKRHVMTDRQIDALGNELLSQRFVERNVFQSAELWGVGSTAPYGHRGDLGTLAEVIEAHGGAGRASRDAWMGLTTVQQDEVIAFLKTLRLPEP